MITLVKKMKGFGSMPFNDTLNDWAKFDIT